MNDWRTDPGFVAGTILGIAGGFLGNLTVTAMYRAIDGSPNGNNWTVTILGTVGFIIIMIILFNRLSKLSKTSEPSDSKKKVVIVQNIRHNLGVVLLIIGAIILYLVGIIFIANHTTLPDLITNGLIGNDLAFFWILSIMLIGVGWSIKNWGNIKNGLKKLSRQVPWLFTEMMAVVYVILLTVVMFTQQLNLIFKIGLIISAMILICLSAALKDDVSV